VRGWELWCRSFDYDVCVRGDRTGPPTNTALRLAAAAKETTAATTMAERPRYAQSEKAAAGDKT
jgi:hypothetical protein